MATLTAITAVALVALAAATATASLEASAGGNLVFTSFNPFSGPDAAFGPEMVAGCDAAVALINAAGGILHHQTSCHSADTHGDPADAVAAANQMIATTGGLVGILGPSSDEALATVPIIAQAGIPMFADTGQAAFDHTTVPYFWRISPADDVKGLAMAIWSRRHHYVRAATFFGNDVGSQSDVPTLLKAFTKLGGKIVSNLAVALDQSSYRSEIERMLAAHPQVVFTETDPQTAATFLSELKQLHGRLLPIIGTETTLEAPWLQATTRAVGAAALRGSFVGVQPYAPTAGASYEAFAKAIHRVKGVSTNNLSLYSTDPFAMGYYDSITIMALAMTAAHTDHPRDYNSWIPRVANPGPGKVIVHTYAAGVRALAAGKRIRFIGASGPADFNRWHNSTGAFEVARFVAAGQVRLVGVVSAQQIAAVNR
jgi:branched-chain amino acid transport system substrate-binding protein